MAYTGTQAGFYALSDPTRREIFEKIARRPQSVAELAAGFSVSRPAVSQHLKVLKDARLVSDRKDGTRHVYRLDPKGVDAMRGYLDRYWERALEAVKSAERRDQDA